MGRPRLRKRHVKVDKSKVMQLVALGFDKKRILKDTEISERSYYIVRNEFEALPDSEKAKVLAEAKASYDERIFEHDYWFKWDYLHHRGESKVPIIQEWFEAMLFREVKEEAILQRIRRFHDICFGVIGRGKKKRRIRPTRIAPQNFTEEDGVAWILLVRQEGKDDSAHRLTIRNFLKYGKGIEPKKISGKKGESYGRMAKHYFKDEESELIHYTIDQTLEEPTRTIVQGTIDFMEGTATRARATRRVDYDDFQDFKFNGTTIMKVTVFDKGKKGTEERNKMLFPKVERKMRKYLAWAKSQGLEKPFPMKYRELRLLMLEIYEKAVPKKKVFQPLHVWRHTMAMHYLRKTGWNYDLVASAGGWKSTTVLKECYGSPEEIDLAKFIAQLKEA